MPWEQHTKYSGHLTKGLRGVHMRINAPVTTRRRGVRVVILIGMDVCRHLEWDNGTRVALFIGTGDHAGQIRIAESDAGEKQTYSLRRKTSRQSTPQFETTPWEGLPRQATARTSCTYEIQDRDLYVEVPRAWTVEQLSKTMEVKSYGMSVPAKPVPVTMVATAGPTVLIDEDHDPEEDPDFDEVEEAPAPPAAPTASAIVKADTLEAEIVDAVKSGEAKTAKGIARYLGEPRSVIDNAIAIIMDQGYLKRIRGRILEVGSVELPEPEVAAPTTGPADIDSFEKQVLTWLIQGVADTPIGLSSARRFNVNVMVIACKSLERKGYIRMNTGKVVAVLFDKDRNPVKQEAAAE